MREILFRGKRLDNGEWVYGSLLQVEIEDGSVVTAIFHRKYPGCDSLVYKDTVGQYTGLLDKNGKRIFDGDIVSSSISRPHEVKWEDGVFCMIGTAIPISRVGMFEVIGNIHDNPELMKGG